MLQLDPASLLAGGMLGALIMALAFALLELRSYKEQMTAVQEMLEVGDDPYPYYSSGDGDEDEDEGEDEEGDEDSSRGTASK